MNRSSFDPVLNKFRSFLFLVLLLTLACDGNPAPAQNGLDIHFAPEAKFKRIEPNYIPTNYGFVWVHWNADNEIYRGRVLISTTDVSQKQRDHLIREELTQSLGLLNDSYDERNSIFYQGWSSATSYSKLDKRLIALLYDHRVAAGMTEAQLRAAMAERIDNDAMRYFAKIAFETELGDNAGGVIKWVEPVMIRLHGSPGDHDIKTLKLVVAEINALVGTDILLKIVE